MTQTQTIYCIRLDCHRPAARKAGPAGGVINPMWQCEEHARASEAEAVTVDDVYAKMREMKTWRSGGVTYTWEE